MSWHLRFPEEEQVHGNKGGEGGGATDHCIIYLDFRLVLDALLCMQFRDHRLFINVNIHTSKRSTFSPSLSFIYTSHNGVNRERERHQIRAHVCKQATKTRQQTEM